MTDAKLDLCLVSPGMPHTPAILAERSLGGSEVAAIYVARALAQRGHNVTVFSPGHTGGIFDDVRYVPIEQAGAYLAATPHDVTVISRALEMCGLRMASTVRVLWCHDLSLKRSRGQLGGASWNLDWVYGVSAWHRDQMRQIHSHMPAGFFRATRNGIDLPTFKALRQQGIPRDPWRLVYGSRPERGLETALNVMAILHRRGRPWRLSVSHYDNTTEHLAAYYQHLWQRAQAAPNVDYHGALTQAQWRERLVTARAMIYPGTPGDFREVSCIAAMEAQAAATPIVAIRKGALPETIAADAGVLLGDEDTNPQDPAYLERFADAIDSLADDATWGTMSDAARARAAQLDWSGVAQQWEREAREAIAARTSDPVRVRAHLRRMGDREALEGVA